LYYESKLVFVMLHGRYRWHPWC